MKVQMMNSLEENRRKNIQLRQQQMQRQMAANQAAMQVAEQQKGGSYMLPNDPNSAPHGSGQKPQPQGLIKQAQGGQQEPEQRQPQGGWQPYWYR